MPHDFGATGGMFDRIGIDLSMMPPAVGHTAEVLADATNWLRQLRFCTGEPLQAPDGAEITDTWNTGMLPKLAPEPNDVVLYKHQFSDFYQTELEAIPMASGARPPRGPAHNADEPGPLQRAAGRLSALDPLLKATMAPHGMEPW